MIPVVSAEFLASAFLPEQFVPDDLPEFAFAGRSNVGKSSLMNMLLGRRNLVKTSKTPGKTTTINFFLVNNAFRFVDLPGYGYAKRSKAQQMAWRRTIETYLTRRASLRLVFLLIDGRHGPQASDEQMAEFLAYHRVPYRCLFTKSDKLSRTEQGALRRAYPDAMLVSAVTGAGKEEVWQCIESLL